MSTTESVGTYHPRRLPYSKKLNLKNVYNIHREFHIIYSGSQIFAGPWAPLLKHEVSNKQSDQYGKRCYPHNELGHVPHSTAI
jgi:hypothetical protein